MKLLVSLAACLALASPMAAQNDSSPPQSVQRKAAAMAQMASQQRASQLQVQRSAATKAWQRRQAGKKAMAAAAARDAQANAQAAARKVNAEVGANAGQNNRASQARGDSRSVGQVSQARNVPVQVRLASAVRQAAQNSGNQRLDGQRAQQIKSALKQRFVNQQRREQRVNFTSKAKRQAQGVRLVNDNDRKPSSPAANNAQNRRRFSAWAADKAQGRSSNPSRQRATRSSSARQPVQKVSSGVRRRAVSASSSRRSTQGAVRTSKPVGRRAAVQVSKPNRASASKARSSSSRR